MSRPIPVPTIAEFDAYVAQAREARRLAQGAALRRLWALVNPLRRRRRPVPVRAGAGRPCTADHRP